MFRSRAFIAYAFAFAATAFLSTACFAADEPATVKPVPRTDQGWVNRQTQINARAKEGDVDLIFLGDSITQGWMGAGKGVWEKYYDERKAMNAGIGGDRTQHVLYRLDHGNLDGLKPKLAVIMIGTNNSGGDSSEDIAAGIKAIVEKLRAKLPEIKILLLGIFPRGPNADDTKRKVNVGANEIAKKLDDGQHVTYLDISEKFLEPDGTLSKEIMPDLLHLSPKGYEIWAEAIEPKVAAVLGDRHAARRAGWAVQVAETQLLKEGPLRGKYQVSATPEDNGDWSVMFVWLPATPGAHTLVTVHHDGSTEIARGE